jgi:hypothetical protein
MFIRLSRAVALLSFASAVAACSTPSYTIHMERDDRPAYFMDETAVSAGLASHPYRKIMVVPPSGDIGAKYEGLMALVEAEFIKRNMTVFTPALTARAITGAGRDEDATTRRGGARTDVERALILAKEANAEAILQIGTLAWTDDGSERFWAYDPKTRQVEEIDELGYQRAKSYRWRASARLLKAYGRLIEVQEGEVMATFRIEASPFHSLPEAYKTTWTPIGREKGYRAPSRSPNSFDADAGVDNADQLLDKTNESSRYEAVTERAQDALLQQVFSRLAQTIAGGAAATR